MASHAFDSVNYLPKEQMNDKNFVFISTFTQGPQTVNTIIHQNWELLAKSKSTRDLHQSKVLIGSRRNPNLRDLFVQAKVKQILGLPGNTQ